MNDSLHFLVVETSLGARILIRSQLIQLGHHVDMAWDYESALDLTLIRSYDLILIDYHLDKGHNCDELIDCLQEKGGLNQNTPIIMLSSTQHHKEKKHTKRQPYFIKPINQKEILKIIEYFKQIDSTK